MFLSLLGTLAVAGAASAADIPYNIKADSPKITYMGRVMNTSEGFVRFNYPGVTAKLKFEGSGLEMLTNPGSGYWMVEVDSMPPKKVVVSAGDSIAVLAKDLPVSAHEVSVTYCIEGFEFKPEIRGFRTGHDGVFKDAPRKGTLKMEFIGNSITCGFGTEAENEHSPFSYDTENHCLGYAYLTARNLNADFNMVCRSGIGVYRNHGGPIEGSAENTMPLEYGYTMLYDHENAWDYSRFMPDVICINLGTNDTYNPDYDLTLFENEYKKFVDRLLSLYPNAKIVLLTGSMLSGDALDDVKGVLDRIASGSDRISRFDMTPQNGDLGFGAGYHPSAAQSVKMSEELTGYLRSIL